jgi:NDP-sugar pyrophosphorylase family protein
LCGGDLGSYSVKVLWHEALKRNRLFCLPHRGRWFQTGTVEDIRKADRQLRELADKKGSSLFSVE